MVENTQVVLGKTVADRPLFCESFQHECNKFCRSPNKVALQGTLPPLPPPQVRSLSARPSTPPFGLAGKSWCAQDQIPTVHGQNNKTSGLSFISDMRKHARGETMPGLRFYPTKIMMPQIPENVRWKDEKRDGRHRPGACSLAAQQTHRHSKRAKLTLGSDARPCLSQQLRHRLHRRA